MRRLNRALVTTIKLTKIVNSVTVSLVVPLHQIDSLALTQASVKQLPGLSDVLTVGRFLSAAVFDNYRKF